MYYLRYRTHFWTNTLENSMNPLIPSAMGEIVQLMIFSKDGFDIK